MTSLTKELVKRDFGFGSFFTNAMLPNPDKIVSTKGGYEALRRLRNDPHLSSCIQSRKSGLLSMDWNLRRNEADEKMLSEVNKMLKEIDLQQFMRDALDAPLYGFQPIEVIWEERKNSVFPKELSAKPQEWFFFDSDGKLRYRTKNKMKGDIPPEHKIINVKHEASYINPYGSSLLSKCFWSVTFKNAGLRFWVNFMEKYGMPLLLGQYTRGASGEEAEKLAQELSNMSEDSVIVTPADINISIKEPMRYSSVDLYKDLIEQCNNEISKAILSQTLTTDMKGGSYAASKVHNEVRHEVVLADKLLIEKAVNELIHSFIKINYGTTPIPIFEIIVAETEHSELIQRDEMLARYCGVKFSKEYLMRRYGFEKDEIDIIQ